MARLMKKNLKMVVILIGTLKHLVKLKIRMVQLLLLNQIKLSFQLLSIITKLFKNEFVNQHFYLKGVKFTLTDEREPEHHDEFQYEDGIKSFVSYLK
jgi:topoisomerase-4 subunit B